MKTIPRISNAEWAIMKQLWAHHPQTANKIAKTLCQERDWKPKTVKTLINRLLAKEVIGFTKNGREYYYFPRVEEDACIQEASQNFLHRVFDGAVKPMLASLIESEPLSDKDIRDLKRILSQKAKD
jgi:BlaI family transcriptional regulator, penicillinase repressor